MTARRMLLVALSIMFVATPFRAWSDFGDVDNSDSVDAVDVQLVINAALSIQVDPSFTVDLDDSGDVNAIDVQLVINAVLGVGPPGPEIIPERGAPGSKVTITGEGFAGSDASRNTIFFGDIEMPVIGASGTTLTTSVPIADAGSVAVHVEVDGSTVLDGFTFEILAMPELTEPPGTLAADAQNDIASVAATVGSFLDPFLETLASEDAEAYGAVLDMTNTQIETITVLLDNASEEEKTMLDQMFVSSGLASELADIRIELDKRKAKLAEIDAAVEKWEFENGRVMGAKRTLPARYRFVLDWTAARLHHAMEYANVALLGLNTVALLPGVGFGGALTVMDLFAAFLNAVYTVIEMSPMQLKADTLTARVGENNVIAAESYAEVVLEGDFEAETTRASAILALFLPRFGSMFDLPGILMEVLMQLGSGLVNSLENPDDNDVLLPSLNEDDVPIYTHDFVGDPPTSPNDPHLFGAGGIAVLSVDESIIYAIEDGEEGTFMFDADQKVYEFKGSFWDPVDKPRVESRNESVTIDVEVKKGLVVNISGPGGGTDIDGQTVWVTGTVRRWDGSVPDEAELTVTIRSGGTTITVGPNKTDFDEEVDVGTGESTITVIVTDGDTTATAGVAIFNRALPTTYCVVTNVNDDSLSLIDPDMNEEFLRFTLDSVIDGPQDALFLPDGETLIVVNKPSDGAAFLSVLQFSDLENVSATGLPLQLGEGWATSLSLTPDGDTLVIPYRDYTNDVYAVHVVDVRQPNALRLADTVPIPQFDSFDDYSPRQITTGVAADGRTVALVTTGFYQDGGSSHVAVLDVTNPYRSTLLGSVSVTSRGGSIRVVPGRPLAVVAGISYFDLDTTSIESAFDLVDFSDPEHVAVRDTLTWDAAWIAGLAVTPDGNTALVANAGNPHFDVRNTMLFIDISDPDDVYEITSVAFQGQGSPRIAVSPEGDTAVVTSHLTNMAVVFDLVEGGPPVANDAIMTGQYPWGVAFRP